MLRKVSTAAGTNVVWCFSFLVCDSCSCTSRLKRFMRACRSRDGLCRLGRLAGFARAITWKLPLHGLKSHTGKIITTNVASLMRRHLAKVAVAAELLQNLTRRLTPSNPHTKQQHTHSKEQTEAKSHTSYQLDQRKPKSHASCSCTKITNQNRMPAPAALRKH